MMKNRFKRKTKNIRNKAVEFCINHDEITSEVILMLPGASNTVNSLLETARRLDTDKTIILINPAGAGRSEKLENENTADQVAKHIQSFIDSFDNIESIVTIAISHGGVLSCLLDSEQIKHHILVGYPLLQHSFSLQKLVHRTASYFSKNEKLANSMKNFLAQNLFLNVSLRLQMNDFDRDSAMRYAKDGINNYDAKAWMDQIYDVAARDTLKTLLSLEKSKVTMLYSEYDTFSHSDAIQKVSDKGLDVVNLGNYGHLIHMEAPEILASKVNEVL